MGYENYALIKKSTLTEIGDAIREKTGSTELIDPANFASEISDISGGEVDLSGYARKEDLDGYAKTSDIPDEYDDTALSNRVTTVENDYLKSSDKTELTQAIATAKTETIEAILGEAVDADFDTLQEVADWIQADTTASAELVVRVTDAESDIANIQNDYLKAVDKTELLSSISTNATAISKNTTDIAKNTTAIEENAEAIADNATAIAVERARIDAFTALPEGSTTGDSALEDIKIKVDGTTADTAGNAVREQINTLDDKIDAEVDKLSGEIADLASAEFSIEITGSYSLKIGQRTDWNNGETITNASRKYAKSDLIANGGGTLIKVKNDEYAFRVAFFGENDSYIGNNGSYTNKVIVPFGIDRFSLTISRYDEAEMTETVLSNIVDIYQKEDIGAIEKQINHDEILVDFELGSIGTTSGANSASENRIRTINYIPFENMTIACDEGYNFGLRFYGAGNVYIAGKSTTLRNDLLSLNINDYSEVESIRIIGRKVDESNISDVSEVANAIHIIRGNVDSTLSKKGYSADAYTVGKMLNKSIKILGIGNSYTRDSFRWLCKILMDCGYDVVVAHGYWGGSTLEQQYESINESSENHTVYQYWKYANTKDAVLTSNVSLDSILSDETWDIVIFQQQSDYAGQYDSFVSESFDINDFVDYVKGAISNENLRIGVASTWSHAEGYSSSAFDELYNGNPTTQYEAIQSVIPQVANHMTQCDFVINSGKAVDLGRNNTYLGALGDEMLRSDKNHLAYGIPSFMVGMVHAITLCGVKPSDVTWYPTITDDSNITTDSSAYLAYLAKQCALQASQSI